jgi:peptidoglycan/xylan/chitin deacetylase (PgdA/CDA1 family)
MPDTDGRTTDATLRLGPRWLYTVKPALTHARTAAWQARRGADGPRPGLRILFYHRVSDDPDVLAVTPRRFGEQMALLRDEGWRVVDVGQAADLLATGRLPERTVALSFDDGYRDIAEHALPVLGRHGFRATVFVVIGALEGRTCFSWYDVQPPVLQWADVVALDGDSAFAFEAHTLGHPNLRALSDDDARREIAGSKAALEERLRRPVTVFCYPAGVYGERERRMVAAAGFRAATSCEPGANMPATDPLALRRIQIDATDRLADFRAKLEGGHDAPSRLRLAYRRVRYATTPAPSSER